MKYKEKLLGKLAVQSQWITQEQLDESLELEESLRAKGEENVSLIEILIDKSYLTKNQSKILIEEWQKRNQKIEEKIQEWKDSEEKQTVICDFCGTQFRLDLEKVQKNLKCGQCGEILPIPEISHGTSRIQKVKKTLAFLGIAPRDTISIPGYKIQEILEENGTWVVYKGIQNSTKKEVIVHILQKDASSDPVFRKKVEQGIQKIVSLEIPNVLKNYGLWEYNGFLYSVSEFSEGETLQAILERNQNLSEVKALKIGIRIVKMLKASWEQDVLHGDIQPGNILITSSGKVVLKNLGLPVRLLKNVFYIAQQQGSAPLYLAPEWVSEDIIPDFRSDIYALGSVLYHILAGKPALEGNTPLVLLNFLTENTPLPPLPFYNPSVSKEVCWIIDKMMALDMENRYSSYGDLLRDLENPQQAEKPKENVAMQAIPEVEEQEEKKVQEETSSDAQRVQTKVKKMPAPKEFPTKKIMTKAESPEKKTPLVKNDSAWQEESSIKIAIKKNNSGENPSERKNKLKKTQDNKEEDMRIINKRNNYGKKIVFVLVAVALVIWYFQKDSHKNRAIRYPHEEEFSTLQRFYNDNREKPEEWKAIEEKCRVYLNQYGNIEYGKNQKNLTRQAQAFAAEIQKFREDAFQKEIQERFQKIDDFMQKEHFLAALESFSGFPKEASDDLKKQIQGKQEQVQQRLQNITQDFERFYAQAKTSQEQDKNTFDRMERFLQALPMHAKEGQGDFWSTFLNLKEKLEELKDLEKKKILEKQKERRIRSQNAVLELEKILENLLLEYNFQRALDMLRHYMRTNEFVPEDRQHLEKKEIYLVRLQQAYKILVQLLEKIKKTKPKIYYENKLRDLQHANESELWLNPNIRVPWAKLPKDHLVNIVVAAANAASEQEVFFLAIFCIYLEEYSLAYQYLKSSLDKIKEARSALEDMEDFLQKKSKEHLQKLEEFLSHSQDKEALQEALLIQGKYLLKEAKENHEEILAKAFQKLFANLYEKNTYSPQFFDFNAENQIPASVLKYAKINMENNTMKFIRGRFALAYKEIYMIAGLCHFSHSNDRLVVQLHSKGRPKYSFQLRANGNLAYQVYDPGNFKNDAIKEFRNQWIAFALVMNKGNAEWYFNQEKRFSFACPEGVVCDSIEFQVSNTMEDRVTSIDNLYILAKEE
ncbi:MAG: serine/threonine protein kinase [Candidatus Brocadiae bacterium]|nr:serine/threonine protein kinase [Candidatus Brocadiia bacterium]